MPRKTDYSKISSLLESFYRSKRRMPSYSEMLVLFEQKSKGGLAHLVGNLIKKGLVKKDSSGRLLPATSLLGGAKYVGSVSAGWPSPAEEEILDTMSLDEWLISRKTGTYIFKVSGDSMIEAGIMDGDLLVVQRGITPKNGHIVIARVDNEYTVKYFHKAGSVVTLRPANPKYKPITPKSDLVVAAVVVGCVRKYQ